MLSVFLKKPLPLVNTSRCENKLHSECRLLGGETIKIAKLCEKKYLIILCEKSSPKEYCNSCFTVMVILKCYYMPNGLFHQICRAYEQMILKKSHTIFKQQPKKLKEGYRGLLPGSGEADCNLVSFSPIFTPQPLLWGIVITRGGRAGGADACYCKRDNFITP